MSETFVRVGKVKDAHGIRGELFVILFSGEAEWIDDLESLRLVNENGAADPKVFSVKSARFHKNGMIVKSPDIKDRNAAEALKGRLLEIPEEFLISEPGEAIYLREILGFKILTEAQGEVGTIEAFSSNVAQDLLVVKTKTGTYEIPFVEAFVKNIDYEAKQMTMDLPVGLLGEETGDDQPEPSAGDDSADDEQ
jgi:16S rRNA processing protein RimM